MRPKKTSDGDIQEKLIARLMRFKRDPAGFVKYAYPWESEQLAVFGGAKVWQAEFLNGIVAHLKDKSTRFSPYRCAIASGHGPGKLLSKSLRIETPIGPRLWGDIQTGDLLFGADGHFTSVIARHEQGVKPIYRVTFDDGSSTLCGLSHLWNVRGRHERRNNIAGWRVLSTEEILEIGVKRKNGISEAKQWEIPIQGSARFPEQEIDLHPYWVGIWLGDGTRMKAEYTKPYPEIVQRLRQFGMEVGECKDGKRKTVYGVKHFMERLEFRLYSYERYIPEDYKFNSIENRTELLRGLLDTDGEIGTEGSIAYSSTSKRLAEDVVWLVRSLGGKAQFQETIKKPWYPGENGERVHCRDCWRLSINLPFNPFTLEHRKARWKPSEHRYLARWIESIEYSHDEDSMCVTVAAPDGLYLANDFIVTHNSALVSMIIHWALSTCIDCKVVVTANTGTQLATKTVPEVHKWFRMGINAHWFDLKATSITARDAAHERTWRADFIPWSTENTEAFSGLHNVGKRIVLIFDEASAISDKIWEVAEGALTDENTEIIWLAFGNPTMNTGRFRECFGSQKHRWKTRQIDSRTVEGTNKEEFARWIEDYGEDSDFVRVRVRGEFPRAGTNQLIPNDIVAAARKFKAQGYEKLPKVLSVDVARYGDDATVIGWRQGRRFSIESKLRGLSTVQVAERVIEKIEDAKRRNEPYDAWIVDGDGLGAGVVDHLEHRGYGKPNLFEFHGGESARDPNAYYNRRAECWGMMRDWLQAGAEIPDDPELEADLTGPQYGFSNKQQLQLEKKEDMKKRGLASPDMGDCAAQTFGIQIAARKTEHKHEYVYAGENEFQWMG